MLLTLNRASERKEHMKKDSLVGGLLLTLFHLSLVVIAVILIRDYAVKCYEYGYRIFKEPPVTTVGEGKTISITISDGGTPKNLGEILESKGLIRDSKLFILQYFCSEYKKDLKAGTYELSSTMTVEEMFAVMAGEYEEEEG